MVSTSSMLSQVKGKRSPAHLLPQELLPTAKTVIAFFLPFEKIDDRCSVEGTTDGGNMLATSNSIFHGPDTDSVAESFQYQQERLCMTR